VVSIPALWLPILLSAVIVFVASALIHMVLTHHRTDYRKLPNEDRVLAALRPENIAPGQYMFPHAATPKDMGAPAMIEKYKQGPIGVLTALPTGVPAMGKNLTQWFVYCLVVGIVVAYVAGRTLGPTADYLDVFRVTGTVAWLAYAGAQPADSIWRGQGWGVTVKNVVDGLVYGLLTGGVFGWLWPR
jgi:hypothetical protein